MPDDEPLTDQDVAETDRERLQKLISTLWDATKHGDEDHRQWLKDAINAHFVGEPVPEPYGKGNKEAEIERLQREHILDLSNEFENGYQSGMDEQAATIARLREALGKYGCHKSGCDYLTRYQASCNCGLNAVLAECEPNEPEPTGAQK